MPADICLWLTHMATHGRPNRLRFDASTKRSELYDGDALSLRSIRRRLSTLKWWLGEQGLSPNPAAAAIVQDQLSGIVRLAATKPKRARGLESRWLPKVLSTAQTFSSTPLSLRPETEESDFIDIRDRTLIAVGFAGAFRISDLANLRMDGVELFAGGALLGFTQRKRSQGYSKVRIVAGSDPARCPVQLLRQYLAKLSEHGVNLTPDSALFRRANRNRQPGNTGLHPASIARIITRRAAVLGIEGISGHSLRRGFIDSALKAGAPISEVMKISGHRDPKTLMLYLDDLESFDNHPGQGLY